MKLSNQYLKDDNLAYNMESGMQELIRHLIVFCAISCGFSAFADSKGDSNFFSNPKTGEGMKITDLVMCTFASSSPDGEIVNFFPTNQGNLMAIPRNGSTGGKPFTYKRIGTTEKGFYRAYESGEVKVFVHRDKPIVITLYGKDQFDAYCNKLIPQFMSE